MENSINKIRTVHLLLSAMTTAMAEDVADFMECCDRHIDLTSSVIAAFNELGYRERTVMGMRLGFNAHSSFAPVPVCRYQEIATTFELTCAASASNIFRRTSHKLAVSIMEAV